MVTEASAATSKDTSSILQTAATTMCNVPVTATATATAGGLLPAATRTTGATAGVALLPTMTGSARQHDATSIMASHWPNSPAFARMAPGLLHEAP
jgi:hypothetical protein